MSDQKVFYLLILLFIFYSCGNDAAKQNEIMADSVMKNDQALVDSVTASVAESPEPLPEIDQEIIPFEIGYDLFHFKDLHINVPFSPDSALKNLFPGHYYKIPLPVDEKDTVILEAWSCPRCKAKQFKMWLDDEFTTFPLKDSNETRFKDTLQFVDDDGRNNILISFSSTEFTTGLLPVGRFTCASMGLALFREEGEKWELKAFSPGVGCYGSYQSIPLIHLLKFGKNNYGCYVKEINGGAGGPFYADTYCFGMMGHSFTMISTMPASGRRFDGIAEWTPAYTVPENSKGGFNEIIQEVTGNYDVQSFTEDDTANTPSAIKQLIKVKNKFSFTIRSHYIFENGAYVFKKEELTTGP